MLKKIKFKLYSFVATIFSIFRIKNNRVFFKSWGGSKYGDKPKIISDALKEYNGLELVWLIDDMTIHDDGIKFVKNGSIKALFYLCTSKVLVNNQRWPIWVKKRQGQFFVQTWHSSGGFVLKKVEKDAEESLTREYVLTAKQDSRYTDLFLSDCVWRTKNIRDAFWYSGEILKCNLTKNYTSSEKEDIVSYVRSKYGIGNQKVLLYAPTFRNNDKGNAYNIDFKRLKIALTEKFGGQWIIFVRLHPRIKSHQRNLNDKIFEFGDEIDVTEYPSLYDLVVSSSFMISDYSGSIVEAYRNGIPSAIFASDYQKYIKEQRELYFDLKNMPSPFAESNDKLIENINEFDLEKYEEKCEQLMKTIGFYKDGKEKIVNRILKETIEI